MPSLSLSDTDSTKAISQSLTDPHLDGVSAKHQKKTKKRKASDIDAMAAMATTNDGDDETGSELVEPEGAREDDNSHKKKKKKKKAKSEEQTLVMEEQEEEEEEEKKEDPNAVSNFRISEPLRLKLKEKGIESLFPIQAMTFDTVLDGSDLVGRARTGQVHTNPCFVCLIIQLHGV